MMNRRIFLGGVCGLLLSKVSLALAQAKTAFSESEPLAKTIQYCTDAEKSAKSNTGSCPLRKEKSRADQFCRNCQLYKKESGEGKAEVGTCPIVAGKTVAGGGWCMSWVKKSG